MGNAASLRKCTTPEEDKFAVAPYLPTIVEEGSVFSDQSSRTGQKVILPPKIRSKHTARKSSQDEMSTGSSLLDGSYPGRMRVLAQDHKKISIWTTSFSSSSSSCSSEAWVTFPPFKSFNNNCIEANIEEEKKEETFHDNNPRSILSRDNRLTPVIEEDDSWTLFKPTLDDNTSMNGSTLFEGVEESSTNDDGGMSLMELSAAFFSVVHEDSKAVEAAVKKGRKQPRLNDRSGAVFKYLERESLRGNKDEVVKFLETAAIVADLLLGQHKLRNNPNYDGQLISQKAMKSDGDYSAFTAASDKSTIISSLLDQAVKEKRQVQGYSEPRAAVQNIFDDLSEVDAKSIAEFINAVTHILKDVKSGDPKAVSERSAIFFRTLDNVSSAAAGKPSGDWNFDTGKGFSPTQEVDESQVVTSESKPVKKVEKKRRWWNFRQPKQPQSLTELGESTPAENPKDSEKPIKGTRINPKSVQVVSKRGDDFDDDDYELTINVGNRTRRSRGEGLLMWFCCVRVDMILKRISDK